jgi:hypothetical protein
MQRYKNKPFMKTNRLDLQHLRNEEHCQFHTEAMQLVESLGAQTLNIEVDFADYVKMNADELETLQQIHKSALSDQICDADKQRDIIFRGLTDAVKSAKNHFTPAWQQAAGKIAIVLNQYGNVARKSYNDETAAITKLLKELTENYSTESELIGLTDWIAELANRNNAFDTLQKTRYSEDAERTTLRMKQVRTDIDNLFRKILIRIDALIIVNGSTTYEPFVREINARIDKYATSIAIRKGKAAPAKETKVK